MKYSFSMFESVYSHARSAFDPSAYARNQKATSLTRVSVTHQPLKIPPGWLTGCLPAGLIDASRKKERRTDSEESEKLISGKRLSFSKNGKLENSEPRTPVYPRRRHTSGKHLTKRSGIRFIPRGLTAAYFPASRTGAVRSGAARECTLERGREGTGAGIPPPDPYYKMPSSPIVPRCTYPPFTSTLVPLFLVLPVEPLNR